MKRFLKHAFAFSLSLLLGLQLFWLSNPTPAFHHDFLREDCGAKANWILQRISNTDAPIDYLFLGSSRTMHGVDDQLLDSLLPNDAVLNLGYCRLGRDLHALLLEQVLKYQSVKYLVLEVRESESLSSHPAYPYLSDLESIWSAPIIGNKKYLTNLGENWRVRYAYALQQFFRQIKTPETDTNQFGYLENLKVANPGKLTEAAKKIKKKEQTGSIPKFPGVYLNQILELCVQHKIALLFWYVPRYGTQDHLPAALNYYQEKGRLLLPPDSLVSSPMMWMDDIHLNDQGTKRMTYWLAAEFAY